jgi:outer membrane lipoprotein carrier protein
MLFKKMLFILMLVLVSMSTHANELLRYLNNLHTFESQFVQSVFNANNQLKQESSGTITVQSPDKFYLEYKKPYKLLYVADGKKLWSYDEDLEQVVVKEQGKLLVNTPAMLLGNPKDLTKSYKIKNTGILEDWLWFELTPKKEDSNFEVVNLAFAENELKAMEMRDNFGQITRLVFSHVSKNQKLAKNKFKFVPPKGVDVIGQ